MIRGVARKFRDVLIREFTKGKPKILDVGGPTYKFFDAIGFEADFYWLNIGLRYIHKKKRRGFPAVNANACKMPFQDESFDIVFSHNVFEHINEPWMAAEECVRVCKKGGLILISTAFSWRHHDPPDYYRFSHQGLVYLFERTGKVKTETALIGKHHKKQIKGERWNEYWKSIYIGRKK